jgi:mRNA interferase MazF
MKAPAPRRGDVWIADVPGDKRRPVLILTRDPVAQILRDVVVAPITSTTRGLTTEVSIGEEAGLSYESVANFDNTLLLARRDLVELRGRVDESTMEAACRALAAVVGC